MTITLPWPDRLLWPNARPHYHAKARATKAARHAAWALTLAAGARVDQDRPISRPIALTVTFCAPDKRHRDRDNAIAACKAYMDGLADALGVNDRRFEPTYKWGEVRKGGAVEVTLAACRE